MIDFAGEIATAICIVDPIGRGNIITDDEGIELGIEIDRHAQSMLGQCLAATDRAGEKRSGVIGCHRGDVEVFRAGEIVMQ